MLGVNVEEIEIPVPWGHLSAKAWGDKNDMPILVFHGIMDNAGSFDHLIPLLPRQFYYICIDLPGHGLSSHFPPHTPIYSLTYVMVYKLIVDYFDRKRYIFMGHSYGGQISILFAQLYPQHAEKLIILDTVTLMPLPMGQIKNNLVTRFNNFIEFEKKFNKSTPPRYAYEEAVDKIQFGRYTPCTYNGALALSDRALVEVESDKYSFRLDHRIKNAINPLHDVRSVLELLKENPITCPMLLLLAKNSPLLQKYMKRIITYFKKRKNVSIITVDGDHDVHNDFAERVAPHISKFLLHKKSNL